MKKGTGVLEQCAISCVNVLCVSRTGGIKSVLTGPYTVGCSVNNHVERSAGSLTGQQPGYPPISSAWPLNPIGLSV